MHLLRTVCEAELWDEALIELKRQSYSRVVKQQETAWRAKIYLGMKRYEEVLQLQEQAKQDACDITPFLAVAYAHLGERKKALRLAQEALRVQRHGAKRALGEVYFTSGDFEMALYWYEQAALNRLDHAESMPYMGKALMALGDYHEASRAYEHAILWALFLKKEELSQLVECYHKTGRHYLAAEVEQLASEL